MTVTKINGFRAPYRSQTFQDQAEEIIGLNGVMRMEGEVSQTGSTITVPPFVFNQNGLIVSEDTTRTIASPTDLEAPYTLVVSAQTSAQVDDLLFQFVKDPNSVGDNEVPVASYDGWEWRNNPNLSIIGTYLEMWSQNVDFGLVGVYSGLQTVITGDDYENQPGVLVDKIGLKRRLDESAFFPIIDEDPETGWKRVDRIVYRRATDAIRRVGTRKFLLGSTFVESTTPDLGSYSFVFAPQSTLPSISLRISTSTTGDNTNFDLVMNDADKEPFLTEIESTMGEIGGILQVVDRAGVTWRITAKSGLQINTQNLTAEAFQIRLVIQTADGEQADIDRNSVSTTVDDLNTNFSPYNENHESDFNTNNPDNLGRGDATGGTEKINDRVIFTDNLPVNIVNSVITSDNRMAHFCTKGYGETFNLIYTLYSEDRSTVEISETSVISMQSEEFDVIIDENDLFHFIYPQGNELRWFTANTNGAIVDASQVIIDQGRPISYPQLIYSQALGKLLFTYSQLQDLNNNQIFFASINTSGSIITDATRLQTDLGNNIRSDLNISQDDLIYVAWENSATLQINWMIIDDVGEIQQDVTLASQNIDYNGTTLDSQATRPQIWMSDTQALSILFLQAKPSGANGIAISTGVDGVMTDLISSDEDFISFDVEVDEIFDDFHILAAQNERVDYIKLFPDFTRQLIVRIDESEGADSVDILQDKKGSWQSTGAQLKKSTFTSVDTFGIDYIGADVVSGGVEDVELFTNQCLAPFSDFDVREPVAGDQVTVSGSSEGNDGDYIVQTTDLVSLNSANDYLRITMETAFNNTESPASGVSGDLQQPDGNTAKSVKHTGDLEDNAYTLEESDADILLTRIGMPGNDILNVEPNSGEVDNPEAFALAGTNVFLDWSDTQADAFTFENNLQVIDLVNTTTWTVSDGSYSMNENDAIYIRLDEDELNQIPQVVNEQNLPFGERIFVFGVLKNNRFNPSGLALGAIGQFVSGEKQKLGEHLDQSGRTRLGLLSDIQTEDLTSVIGTSNSDTYPTSLSQTNIMAGQNRHTKLVSDGAFTWVKTTADQFVIEDTTQVSVPGVPVDQNNIQPAAFTINDGQMLYVDINREDNGGTPVNILPQVADIDTFALGRNTFVIARRRGNNVFIDPWETMITPGNSHKYGSPVASDELTERRVRVINLQSTTLPAGAAIVEDGVSLNDGDKVLYANAALNGIYQVSGIGSSAEWLKLDDFQGDANPGEGQIVRVDQGTNYFRSVWQWKRGSWQPLQSQDITGEPTGFPNTTQSSIAFDETTRTFSITFGTDVWDYFIKGEAFRKDAEESIVISDDPGFHYIYYNGATLSETTQEDDRLFQDWAFVASIYWNPDQQQGVIFGEQRHGVIMDGRTHLYLHEVNGARVTGMNIGNTDTTGDGTQETDTQLSISDGQLINEDLFHQIRNSATPDEFFEQILDPVAEIPVLFRDGDPGTWRRLDAQTSPLSSGATRLHFNEDTGGSNWQRTEATADGKFIAYWIVATDHVDEPVVSIMGQAEYDTLEDAQEAEGIGTINRGDLPANDSRAMYRLIYETNAAYTNTFHAALRDIADFRGQVELGNPSTPTDHGSLSGLTQQDHPASAIFTNTAQFRGFLSQEDTDVQQSLDTIDQYLRHLQIEENPGNPKRVILTPSEFTKSDGTSLRQQINNFVMKFDGAQIDFSTGEVFELDGVTPLGIDFQPADIEPGQFRWYSLALTPLEPTEDTRLVAGLVVAPAQTDGATKDEASKAVFQGSYPIGQVAVQQNAGDTGIEDISQDDVIQLSIGPADGGGGGGGGTGGGGAAISPSDGYRMAVVDLFDVDAVDINSFVNATRTNGVWSLTSQMWTILCDKDVECSTTGTDYTFTAFPGFTVNPGDVIYSPGQGVWRVIDSVTDQQNGTIDKAFPIDLSSETVMVSQAVWTKDLVNAPGDPLQSTRPRDVFPDTEINVITCDYFDSLVPADTVADYVDEARIVVSATSYGEQDNTTYPTSERFTAHHTRVEAPEDLPNYELNLGEGVVPVETYDGSSNAPVNLDYADVNTLYGYVVDVGSSTAIKGVKCGFTFAQDTPDLFVNTTVRCEIYTQSSGEPDTLEATSLEAEVAGIVEQGDGTYIIEFEFAETYLTSQTTMIFIFRFSNLPTTNVWQAALANQAGQSWGDIGAYTESTDDGANWNTTAFGVNEGPWYFETLTVGGAATSERLFLVFFCNPDNTDVTASANVVEHRTSLYIDQGLQNGGTLDSAYCMSDGSGDPVNCENPILVDGKTVVNLDFNYVPNINPGEPAGELEVIVDGKFMPRFIEGVTLDGYYKEVEGDNTAIEFWTDLSVIQISIDVRRRQGTLDSSDQNRMIIQDITTLVTYDSADETVWIAPDQEFLRIQANSTNSSMTIVFPASPSKGNVIHVTDGWGTSEQNNINISFNGENFLGQPDTDSIDLNYASVSYEYQGQTTGWIARDA